MFFAETIKNFFCITTRYATRKERVKQPGYNFIREFQATGIYHIRQEVFLFFQLKL